MEASRVAGFGLHAWEQMRACLARNDTATFWFYAHAFVTSAGNLSKLLWADEPESPSSFRGSKLRANLELGSRCDTLREKKLRNHFEHFEDRLETWAKKSSNHNFVDSSFGVVGRISGFANTDILRNFDPDTDTLSFQGQDFALRSVHDAMQLVLEQSRLITEREMNRWHRVE